MEELRVWLNAAGIDRRNIFRRVTKMARILGEGITEKAVWYIVKDSAKRVGLEKLAPHDPRRTCARLCHAAGGELEQIQFLLGMFPFRPRSATWLQAADSVGCQ
jgi:site-specific recombinase XerD